MVRICCSCEILVSRKLFLIYDILICIKTTSQRLETLLFTQFMAASNFVVVVLALGLGISTILLMCLVINLRFKSCMVKNIFCIVISFFGESRV